MAVRINRLGIPLDGTGTEIPTLNITDPYEEYLITGTVVSTGNYTINPTGTPQYGDTFLFRWKANLDLVTNGNTLSIFGKSITDVQATKKSNITCYYDGSAWNVEIDPSFGESGIVETDNIQTGAITNTLMAANSIGSAQIQAGAVGTTDLADGSVTAVKLASDSVITVKILDQNVTTAKIADLNVTTGKINANAVTNAKLAQMASNTVKANVTGVTADPQDVAISVLIGGISWNLNGNAGTTPGTDFIGTSDAEDLIFKVNSTLAGIIGESSGNVSLGLESLFSVASGQNNTAIGAQSLYDLTNGGGNTAIGQFSLANVTTGIDNIGIGQVSGSGITNGQYNTIIGADANVTSAGSINRIALGRNASATADNQFRISDTITDVDFDNATILSEGLEITSKTINTTAGDSATINATAGRFRKDTSGAAFTLTNSYITANSVINLTAANAVIDATATGWTVLAAGGSATITFNAAPTANFDMNFWIVN